MKNLKLATTITAALTLQPVTIAAGQGDMLFEASLYLRNSAEAVSACKPKEAAEWAGGAAERMRTAGGDTKSVLETRTREAANNAHLLEGAIAGTAVEVDRLRSEGRLETATTMLVRFRTEYPQCKKQLTTNESALDLRKKQAVALARKADEMVRQDPRRALTIYEEAHRLNREHEGILAGMRDARARKPRRSYKAVKAVVWITFAAALGTGGYVYIDRYRSQQRARTPSSPPIVRR